jgi:hypothetical protein
MLDNAGDSCVRGSAHECSKERSGSTFALCKSRKVICEGLARPSRHWKTCGTRHRLCRRSEASERCSRQRWKSELPPTLTCRVGKIGRTVSSRKRAVSVKTMATIQNERVITGLSGMVGRQLAVHRNRQGQPEICAANSDPNQSGYSDAPDSRHRYLYEALFCSRTAPNIAYAKVNESRSGPIAQTVSADVIYPPEIHKIDITKYTGRAGDTITITAGDDAHVASVGVLIVTDQGILVEMGSARISDQNPYVWTYTATVEASSRFVRIAVDVADIAPQDEDMVTTS